MKGKKKRMRQTMLALAVIACGIHSTAAMAFADDEARAAILEIREQIKASQRSQVGLMTEIEQLRSENLRLHGEVEALTRQVKLLDARLVEVEPATVELDGRVVSVKPAERRDFDKAVTLYRNRDFAGCIAAMESFAKAWPNSAYLANVDYWIASSHYSLNDYKSAIKVTQSLVKKYTKSPKVPDALLLQASAYLSEGEIAKAKKALQNITTRFPKSEQAKTAKERLNAIQKLG